VTQDPWLARRLRSADHAVLVTLDKTGEPQPVPVCFIPDDSAHRLFVPVDTVKPKSDVVLQRVRNLRGDPRASLLAECWDPEDWSQLWWVRAVLRYAGDVNPNDDEVAWAVSGLVSKHPQYEEAPFSRLLDFDVLSLRGWSASTVDR
jgi:PPOX class probable F420-dependent enzyme